MEYTSSGFCKHVSSIKMWKWKTKIDGDLRVIIKMSGLWFCESPYQFLLTRLTVILIYFFLQQMLPPIFPPQYNIVKKYVQMYHRALASHVSPYNDQSAPSLDAIVHAKYRCCTCSISWNVCFFTCKVESYTFDI